MYTEKALLRNALKLDEAALAHIFDTFYGPIFSYIYNLVEHVQLTEDMTADVFDRLLEHLSTGTWSGGHMKTWLYQTAHHLVTNYFEGQHHPTSQPPQIDDPTPGTMSFSRLTLLHRATFILTFLVGMKCSEIAQILELPLETVDALQQRILFDPYQNSSGSSFSVLEENLI